jgi:hypothetical protein
MSQGIRASLTVATGALVYASATIEGTEGLDLADDLAAGAVRIEDLVQKAKEGAAQVIDAVPAIGAFVGLGQ